MTATRDVAMLLPLAGATAKKKGGDRKKGKILVWSSFLLLLVEFCATPRSWCEVKSRKIFCVFYLIVQLEPVQVENKYEI